MGMASAVIAQAVAAGNVPGTEDHELAASESMKMKMTMNMDTETETVTETETEMEMAQSEPSLYWFNKLFWRFPVPLFHGVVVSWFVTHSAMLIRNQSAYKVASTKLLYCTEMALCYALSVVFWCNDQFDGTLFALMLLTTPWTVGLMKAIWEHDDLLHDDRLSRHVTVFNLWFFIAVFLSFCWNWVADIGLFWALFSPNALVMAVPVVLVMHSMPLIVDEVVWATDF